MQNNNLWIWFLDDSNNKTEIAKYEAQILDPTRLLTFWITFEGTTIKFGQNEQTLMEGTIEKAFTVTHMAYSTMFDNPGLFYLPCKFTLLSIFSFIFFIFIHFIDTKNWRLEVPSKYNFSGKRPYHKAQDRKHSGRHRDLKALKSQ